MYIQIIESEPLTANMLQLACERLWPQAQIQLTGTLFGARLLAQQQQPTLALLAARLPDGNGLDFLRDHQEGGNACPYVLITSKVDRALVIRAKRHGVRGILTQPISSSLLLQRLQSWGPCEPGAPQVGLCPVMDLESYLANEIELQSLKVPYDPALKDGIEALVLSMQPMRDLYLLARSSPVLVANLLAQANRKVQATQPLTPVSSVPEALKILGTEAVLILAQTVLLQSHELSDPDLVELAKNFEQRSQMMAKTAYVLAKKYEVASETCYSAAMLPYLGELAVLRLIQSWRQLGGQTLAKQSQAVLAKFSVRAAIKIKADLQLPVSIRELVAAIYEMPEGRNPKEKLVVRLAALMNQDNQEQGIQEVMRHLVDNAKPLNVAS